MITRTQSFQTSDNQVFATIEEAQANELVLIGYDADMAKHLIKDREKIIDILTTGPNSKPKARKANGGTKIRKSKAPAGTLPLPNTQQIIEAADIERAQ